jgi:hypothetical protein
VEEMTSAAVYLVPVVGFVIVAAGYLVATIAADLLRLRRRRRVRRYRLTIPPEH